MAKYLIFAEDRMGLSHRVMEEIETSTMEEAIRIFHQIHDEDYFEVDDILEDIEEDDFFSLDNYMDDPQTQQGWAQQVLIGTHRRER